MDIEQRAQIRDGQIVEGWFLSPKERTILRVCSNGDEDGHFVLSSIGTECPRFSVREVAQEILFSGGMVSNNLRVLGIIPDTGNLTVVKEDGSL
mgnify:CR=1 FL=1